MSIKNIAVIGASKGIGLATISVALEHGLKVRALAPQTETLPHHQNITPIQGSVLNPENVLETVEGVEAVVIALGHSVSIREISLFSAGTKVVIDTLLGWNPNAYLLVVTGIGSGDSAGHGSFMFDKIMVPMIYRKIIQDKNRQEALVRASKLDWCIVRPGFLTDGPLTGVYRCMSDLEGVKAAKISRLNCGDFLIREATAEVWKGKSVLIG